MLKISRHQFENRGKVRIIAILLFVLEIGIMFAYGFGAQFVINDSNFLTTKDNTNTLIFYTTSAILALLGWGLIIAYSQNSAISGLTTTLLTAGLFVQLGPLLSAFWNYLYNSSWSGRFSFSILNEWQIMWGIVSMLICFCFVSGRLGLSQTITTICIFCAGWNANYFFLEWIRTSSSAYQGKTAYFDAIGTTYVYIFAAVVGLIISIAISRNPGRMIHSAGSRHSAFIGIMGTGFAFAAAPFSGSFAVTTAGFHGQPLYVYFTLTSSVVFTYISSAIFGDFKVGIRESLVGVLGGTAMIGAVAGYINNIGACLAIGAAAGFISGLWLRIVFPKLNSDNKIDQLGLIGPVLINGLIGSIVIAPTVFGAYKDLGITVTELGGVVTSDSAASYFLAITGATLVVALITGVVAAIFCVILRDPTDDFYFVKLVSNEYGLFTERPVSKISKISAAPTHQEGGHTASHLRHENQEAAEPVV